MICYIESNIILIYKNKRGPMYKNNISKIILVLALSIVMILYLSLFVNINNKADIQINQGYCDLSEIDLRNETVYLDGVWEFYPNEIKSENFYPSSYINVPQKWNDKENKIGTYRLRLQVAEEGLYSLNIENIFSAYNLIINNREVIQNGCIGDSYETEISSWQPRIVQFYANSMDIEIVIQVTNYHNNKGGIINNISFGDSNKINKENIVHIIKSSIIIGSFACTGIYLIFLFNIKNKQYVYLYLGGFCYFALLLESIIDASIIYYIFENISFNIISKLEYISYIGTIITLRLFLKSIFINEINKTSYRIIMTINIIYLICVFLLPFKIFAYNDIIYIFILLINCFDVVINMLNAIKNKKNSAILFLISILIMLFTIIIDILSKNNYININIKSNNYMFGITVFLLCQIYILSEEVKDAFENYAKAKEMEIAFLQAQIAPHFIFNTLNNIYCLMNESIEKARELILNFSDFLRVKHKFDYRKEVFYTLKEEISLIESYIKIENSRFNDGIYFKTYINEECESVLIPPLLLQPIVENSIKHGFRSKNITISIYALKKGNNIEISICDNGQGMGNNIISQIFNDDKKNSGVGLKNVNFRLIKFYNSNLNIFSEISKGTKIVFEIPMEV